MIKPITVIAATKHPMTTHYTTMAANMAAIMAAEMDVEMAAEMATALQRGRALNGAFGAMQRGELPAVLQRCFYSAAAVITY